MSGKSHSWALRWRLLVMPALFTAVIQAAQIPLAPPSRANLAQVTKPMPNPKEQTTTLVDLLSASPDHSHLLYLLQRARLIPTLNRLNDSTFFAPVNSAFDDAVEREANLVLSERVWTWALEGRGGGTRKVATAPDNVQIALRQRLLYHVLNFTLPYDPEHAPSETPDMVETMYLPIPLDQPDAPGEPGKDPQEGVIGMLAGRGQQVRVMRRTEKVVDDGQPATFIGVDGAGRGGVSVVKVKDGDALKARNGVLIPLGGVLELPPSLAKRIAAEPSLSKFAALLPPALKDHLEKSPHITLFAPSDEAFKGLSDLEWKYLKSAYGQAEMMDIYGAHASKEGLANGSIVYREELKAGVGKSLVMVGNQSVDIQVDDKGVLRVNGSAALDSDILASNGVLHIVPHLLLPDATLDMTVEKYLLALDCGRFVNLFRSAKLSDYFNGTEATSSAKYTILAPRDDVIDDGTSVARPIGTTSGWEGGWNTLPPEGSDALEDMLRYHVVSGTWKPADLDDGMLLGTELVIKHKLAGHRQRVTVSVSDSDGKGSVFIKGDDKAKGLIGFGGASVVAEPVTIGSVIIYLLSQVLEPPSNAVQVAVTDLRLSTFVAALYAAKLDGTFRTAPAVTYFVPSNTAFEKLGLVMNYLLLPTAKPELRGLLEYHAVDDILYLDDPDPGSRRYPTLEGSEIFVERIDDGNTTLHGPSVSGFPANGDTRDARVIDGDWLTATGALHIIDQVELPPKMEIGIGKLMMGAKANTMFDVLRVSNMTWILDGSEPDEETLRAVKKKKGERRTVEGFEARSFTLLCPTDTAFTRINLTYYLNNPPLLRSLVQQHIIPSDPPSKSAIRDPSLFPTDGRPLALEDGREYPTLLSESGDSYGDVAFRSWGVGGWIVGIKNARGSDGNHDAGRILQFGRASPRLLREGDLESQSEVEADGKGKAAKMAFGGGVLTIDAVLVPYEPDAWHRWGWIVATVLVCVVGALAITGLGWKLWKSKREAQYVVIEGQEEELGRLSRIVSSHEASIASTPVQ